MIMMKALAPYIVFHEVCVDEVKPESTSVK
jgi:hypothetical protein